MKKFVLFLLLVVFVTGCGKENENTALKDFTKTISSTTSYNLTGEMELISNNEKYQYDVDVYYLKGDYYKVVLKNKGNSVEQIILKNDDGVYV